MYVSHNQFLTTCSPLANYLTKGLKEMTNTWPGKPVCRPRNETSNLRNRKQFEALYPDLERRFQSTRNVKRIYIVCWHIWGTGEVLNPLKPELNPICYLLALLRAHHFLHVSRIRVKLLTFRLLMSYTYGAPILDVSRSHTTTQHSR